MAVSVDQALETLKSMFPEFDSETISLILSTNNYHFEQTLESILSMSSENSNTSTPPIPSPIDVPSVPQVQNTLKIKLTLPPGVQGGQLLQVKNPQGLPIMLRVPLGAQPGQVITADIPWGPQNNTASSPRSDSKYRGKPCRLPENFLKVPSPFSSSQTMADEQLATVLQDQAYREGGGEEGREGQRVGERGEGEGGDMGIVKSLTSVGSQLSKSISSFSSRLSTPTPTPTQPTSSSSSSPSSVSSSSTSSSSSSSFSSVGFPSLPSPSLPAFSLPRMSNPLRTQPPSSSPSSSESHSLLSHQDEDGEGEEVIDFSSASSPLVGRQRHALDS